MSYMTSMTSYFPYILLFPVVLDPARRSGDWAL